MLALQVLTYFFENDSRLCKIDYQFLGLACTPFLRTIPFFLFVCCTGCLGVLSPHFYWLFEQYVPLAVCFYHLFIHFCCLLIHCIPQTLHCLSLYPLGPPLFGNRVSRGVLLGFRTNPVIDTLIRFTLFAETGWESFGVMDVPTRMCHTPCFCK